MKKPTQKDIREFFSEVSSPEEEHKHLMYTLAKRNYGILHPEVSRVRENSKGQMISFEQTTHSKENEEPQRYCLNAERKFKHEKGVKDYDIENHGSAGFTLENENGQKIAKIGYVDKIESQEDINNLMDYLILRCIELGATKIIFEDGKELILDETQKPEFDKELVDLFEYIEYKSWKEYQESQK